MRCALDACGAFPARRIGLPRQPPRARVQGTSAGSRVHGSVADVATGAAVNHRPTRSRSLCDRALYKSSYPLLSTPHTTAHQLQFPYTSDRHPGRFALLIQSRSPSSFTLSVLASVMATMAMTCFTPLAAGSGARPSTRPPTAIVAPRRRGLVVRAQNTDKSAGQRLRDTLAYIAPAAERINGRLAMVGFVSALAVEACRGDGLFSQVGSGSGLAGFAISAAVFSLASLVPLLEGERAEDRSRSIWTADAELWNGRAAMIGLISLAATEYLKGTPFINV